MTDSHNYNIKTSSKDLLKEAKEALNYGKDILEIFIESLQDNEINSLIYDSLAKDNLDEEELKIKYTIEGILALRASKGRNK